MAQGRFRGAILPGAWSLGCSALDIEFGFSSASPGPVDPSQDCRRRVAADAKRLEEVMVKEVSSMRTMRSIIDRLFRGKAYPKEITIKPSNAVKILASGRIYIGRTPGRFLDIKGHSVSNALSIKDALDILGANQAATRIFPLAATPGGHWVYFALFSACTKTPGVNPLKQYISVLKNTLNRRNAGVASRLLSKRKVSTRQVRYLSERYRHVHDVRMRIPDVAERRDVIQHDVLPRLHSLIMSGRWNRQRYRSLARAFRTAWCRQSQLLRTHGNGTLVKQDAPHGLRDMDLIRVYAGYWLIRSLYGIEIKDADDEIRRIDNADLIRRSAKTALRYFAMLTKRTHQNYDNMIELLEDARKTGEPPLIHEYYRRQAEGGRVLSGFRLRRFWQILGQLDRAVQGGT